MFARPNFWTLVAIFTWALLILLLFLPVGSVLTSSLYDRSGQFSFTNYLTFFSEPRFFTAFVNTLVVGSAGWWGR